MSSFFGCFWGKDEIESFQVIRGLVFWEILEEGRIEKFVQLLLTQAWVVSSADW